jgi:hypothetical protein
MSIFDMAFYPVPVKVPGNLLFLGLDSIILLFFLGSAVVFFFYSLLRSLSRYLLLRFGCDILQIRICHRRMGSVSRLLHRRVFFLSFRRVAGRRSRIHGDGG